MRAVIISGGSVADYDFIKSRIEKNDVIICADSGYDHAVKMSLCVSAVVGDFDSIQSKNIPADIEIVRVPAKKDLTDTELALKYAREKGFRDFLFLAATGSRFDHSLANVMLLKGVALRGESAVIIDEHNKIMMTNSEIHLHEPVGSIVSLIPVTDCSGVNAKGFEYPLSGADMQMGEGLGISNVMTKSRAAVSVERGFLLVVVARDDYKN